MKLLLIGHTGTLGKILFNGFSEKKEIELITASRQSGDYQVEIESEESVKTLFSAVGKVDAIVSAAGSTIFKPFSELVVDDFKDSIASKLQGQINLAMIGKDFLVPNGSITLTAGIIKDEFIPMGTPSALVNGALASFVKSTSFEVGNGIRINSVSPNALSGSWGGYESFFKGFIPVSDIEVFAAYEKSVFGIMTGQDFKVY